jgi:hypothetical protein
LYNPGIDDNDWGDYRKENFLGALPPFTEDTETIVDIPDGLSAGEHNIWFYADPMCTVQGESFENNNAYGPYIITISASTLTATSTAAHDGWIREQTETSGKGATKNNGADFLYIGDDAIDRQYLSILSFNTAGLPDNAVITSVFLKFKLASITGTSPFVTQGPLFADFKKGLFSNDVTLSIFDFKAPANRNRAMSITNGNLKSNNWYSQVLASNYFKLINKTGTTQVRLRFARDDDNDNRADILLIYSGNSTSANRPKLIIDYYVP